MVLLQRLLQWPDQQEQDGDAVRRLSGSWSGTPAARFSLWGQPDSISFGPQVLWPFLLEKSPDMRDVLSVSSSIHRVLDVETPPAFNLQRSGSLPVELGLLKQTPAMPAQVHWHEGRKQVLWLVFLFVSLDVTKSFAVSWAAVHGHMCAPLVICAKNVASIGCGMLLAAMVDGAHGVGQCLDIRRALPVLPIAAFFSLAQVLTLQALRVYDAGSLKIGAQINLPITACLSWLILRRRYSARQWLATLLLLSATMAFLQVRMLFFDASAAQGDNPPALGLARPDKIHILGAVYFLLSVFLSCGASIAAELFLKTRYEIPFYIQKTNLMLGELVSAGIMVLWFDGKWVGNDDKTCSWEQVKDWRQLPVILVWFTHGWIAGLLVKRCSALVKNVSHILSALVTYFLPLLLVSGTRHSWTVTLAALLVLTTVLLFATQPRPAQKKVVSKPEKKQQASPPQEAMARPKSEADVVATRGRQRQPAPQRQATTKVLQETAEDKIKRQVSDCTHLQVPAGHAAGNGKLLAAPSHASGNGKIPAAPMVKAPSKHSLGLLVLCFILLDATKPMLVNWAQQGKAVEERFINGTFILVQTSLSLLVGLAIAAQPRVSMVPLGLRLHPDWRHRVGRCIDPHSVYQQLPVSGCLCLSKLFLMIALGRLDAGTVRVFGQASLPLVGVVSALFFEKKYTANQWCALITVTIALMTFYHVKAEVQEKRETKVHRIDVTGVLSVIASITFNCLGALFVEKFLKRNQRRFHEQKAQLLAGEVIVNAMLLPLVPAILSDPDMRRAHSAWHRGFFAGWDRRVLMCAIVWIPAGWTTSMLVKRGSHMLKAVAQGTASVLTFLFTVVPLHRGPRAWSMFVQFLGPPLQPQPLSSPVILLAISVMLSAITFGVDASSNAQKTRRLMRVAVSSSTAQTGLRALEEGSSSPSKWAESYRSLHGPSTEVQQQLLRRTSAGGAFGREPGHRAV